MGTGLSAARDDHQAPRTPRHATSTGTPGAVDTDTDTAAHRTTAHRSGRTAGEAVHRHTNHRRVVAGDGEGGTEDIRNGRAEPQEAVKDKGHDGALTVTVQPEDFRLPDVLRQIEAGRIVFVVG